MNNQLSQSLNDLKSALLSLRATGEGGFEGLIGVTLHEITGVPFRLACSGSQFGIDGNAACSEDAVCFEGKRYDGIIPKSEILSKIAELSISDFKCDLWVLGATSQIGSQLADEARKLGTKDGIVVLILDWSKIDLPPFAVALAMGGTRVVEFLKTNIGDTETIRKAVAALGAVRDSPDFSPHAERIQAECTEPTVGWGLAKTANTAWLSRAFSNRKRAKLELGQPLSPGDLEIKSVRQRKNLTDILSPYLTNTPDKTVVFITGGEGNGKSWIVAQSWLALMNKPLMIFMSPDEFAETARQINVVDLLVSKLIQQTGDRATDVTKTRWRRRFEQWRDHPVADSPRLIVFIDGINQRPKSDWARIIEVIADELNRLSGFLIVTVRTPYFQDHVKRRLSIPPVEISVAEWTDTERDEILKERGIVSSDLQLAVASSLRNPRLLGIALELLDNADIVSLEELSVSRLLFEHMLKIEQDGPEPQPVHVFKRRLQKLAQEILSRIKTRRTDDLTIFENEMGAVADGRFFHAVDGDPTRYSLKDDGLRLALGFAVIDQLRIALRNSHDIDVELNAILDPIAALDDTANVILAALTVNTIDERYEQDIAAALVKGFSALQNPDPSQFPVFAGLAKKRPQGFLDATHTLCLAGGYQPNFDWIQDALIEAGKNSNAWLEMANRIHCWLSIYSLSPERGAFSHPEYDSQEKVQEEREKNRKKIEEKLQSLSANEQAILSNLHKEEGDISKLSSLALTLLAGKPLALFAKSFLNWSFSNALNSDHAAPVEEFKQLVSFNRIDWSMTRASLLEASLPLRERSISRTGKWALVTILRATGQSEDDKKAQSLVEELTKGLSSPWSWRLIEKYCAVDPCDPESEQPENITQTAANYAGIDVTRLCQDRAQTSEDLFFDKARPGMARFKPEVAIAKHREYFASVLNRTGFPLQQGLLEFRQHNALLSIKEASGLIKNLEVKKRDTQSSLSEPDRWIVSQYHLLLAFPFLSALEQSEVLLSNDADNDFLLDLIYVRKTLSEEEFDSLLGTACSQNNERMQYLILAFANQSIVNISKDARTTIAALVQSESERVRAQALGVIAQSNDPELLGKVCESGWKASDTKPGNDFEAWYGSMALLEAAVRGLIAHEKVIDRISVRLYGRAAILLEANAVREIAHRIDASITTIVGLSDDLVTPDLEIQVNQSTLYRPSMFNVSGRSSEAKDVLQAPEQVSESNESFEQRQKRGYNAFHEFKENLDQAKASIILDELRLEEFAALVAVDEEHADRWYTLFISIPEKKLPVVHNLVLLLAHALAAKSPAKAEYLFCRVKESKPLVRFTFGGVRVELDAMAVWASARSPGIDDLCFARLDRAANDHDLSLEVFAAQLNGQQELLTTYIEAKLRKEEPAAISRGIMVAGFSDQSELTDKILKRYELCAGLIGSAQKAAKYAYERNIWARYWFETMCQTKEDTDFWRYSILFLKIVDGRFAVWRSCFTQHATPPMKLFGPAVGSRIKNRFEKWENHRKKTLFGLDAPELIFLAEAHVNK